MLLHRDLASINKHIPVRTTDFVISFVNIRSILPKRDEMRAYIDDSNNSCDIVALTEMWLQKDIRYCEEFPSDINMNACRHVRSLNNAEECSLG